MKPWLYFSPTAGRRFGRVALTAVLVLLAALAGAQTPEPADLALDETFADNRRGWAVGDFGTWSATLTPGELTLTARDNAGYWNWLGVAVNFEQDFTIEAEMQTSTAGGLVWGGRSWRNSRLFGPLVDGCAVTSWRDGQFYWSANNPVRTAAIQPAGGWNSFRMERRGPQLRYLLNGQLVYQEAYTGVRGNRIGFQIGNGGTLRVRRLRVWHRSHLRLAPAAAARLAREEQTALNDPQQSESMPIVTPDGRAIYFSRGNVATQLPNVIHRARRRADGRDWETPVDVGPPLNNNSFNAVMGITPDGQTLLLTGHYLPDGRPAATGGCSLSHRRPDGSWSVPEPIIIPGLPARASHYYYSLAASGQTLVVATGNQDDPEDPLDLYFSHRDPGTGRWSALQGLGPDVNTLGYENSPFLAADGKTLYFNSDGHGGYGHLDLFVTQRLDDTWQRWSPPLNLGPTFNSVHEDCCLSVPAAGDYAYWVTGNPPHQGGDVFRARLVPETRPQPTLLVRGQVRDARSGRPVAAAVVYETLPAGTFAGRAQADTAGRFEIVLPAAAQYGFRAEAAGYVAASDYLDLTALTTPQETTQDLLLLPVAAPVAALPSRAAGGTRAPGTLPEQLSAVAVPAEEKITLNNVFFVRGKAILLPGSFPELRRLAQTLQEHPELAIRLDGHTDNVGTAAELQTLSEQRVVAVKNFLVRQGVQATRLDTRGYGGTRPVAPNDTETHKARNRRVEFVIVRR
ncbi:hypothetical protein EJV47_19550 [Hymenobacter gummosus]|uniref:OmpA-like domain-containing protein n=1 Tax=Hymenobacter gummosus TaxID=1776032 RepID=A0A431TYY9_9BACT|nr:OmpA family protein [Hymenobacter gummosus]RTQ47094.1 hypothetical protein EJV47_19550 [Hymenobacter gummosus]